MIVHRYFEIGPRPVRDNAFLRWVTGPTAMPRAAVFGVSVAVLVKLGKSGQLVSFPDTPCLGMLYHLKAKA